MPGYRSILREEFKGYDTKKLSKDLMAGLTVAAVALPLALAFGISSGADASAGLITAIVAGLVITAFSGAFYQISGPTGAMAAVLIPVIARYELQGVFEATVIAGLILLLAGIFRLGKLTSFIPAPVITGFTSGISLIIALGQIDAFFGIKTPGESALEKIAGYFQGGSDLNLYAMGIGLFVIALMLFFPKKWNAVIPASLLGIIAATAISIVADLPVDTIGEIPRTLLPAERLRLSGLSLDQIAGLIPPAFSIAILGMIESLLCGASAGRMTGKRLDGNQELIAQGIGNLILPFFGGIPATAAIARTSVAIKSGAQTRLTGIFHAVGLLISMFLLAPVMSAIPLSALSGVLLVTAWRMNEWASIKYMFSRRFKGAILKFLVTMLATILFDLAVAILVGVFVGLVLLAMRLSKNNVSLEIIDIERAGLIDHDLISRYKKTCVIYITGPVIFTNTQSIEDVAYMVDDRFDTVIFSMRGASHLDVSGAQAMLDVIEGLKKNKMDVIICGLSQDAKKIFDRSGITELLGEHSFYWSVDKVLAHNRPHLWHN